MRAMGGQLRWIQEVEVTGFSAPTMLHWKQRYAW